MKRLFRIITWLLDLLFPRTCIICEEIGTDLCEKCIARIKWPKPKPRSLQWITSIWNYRDKKAMRIVVTLKNRPHNRLAITSAHYLMSQIMNQPANPEAWVLVPIPISNKRFRERGYNQAELLARAFQKALRENTNYSFPILNRVLKKVKSTQKQGTTESREERMLNMEGAFTVVQPEKVSGKCVILIDDVTTTGATLAEARRALIHAGAKQILAWTVAN